MTFKRALRPFTMVIEDLGTLRALLRMAITASFASPSTGGAFVYTFKPSLDGTTLDWELLGMTLRNNAYFLILAKTRLRLLFAGRSPGSSKPSGGLDS